MKIIDARRYDKKLAYNRKWKKANRDKVNKLERKYYVKNKDRILARQRMRYTDGWKCTIKDIFGNECKKPAYHRTAIRGKITIRCERHLNEYLY